MSTILKPIAITPSAMPQVQTRFGHEGHDHDHDHDHTPPTTPTPPAKKKGSGCLGAALLLFVGGFMTLWASIFVGSATTMKKAWDMSHNTPVQVSQNAIGTAKASIGPIAFDTTITKDKQVFAGEILVGNFNDQGEAFSAQGLKVGHADEQGNMYLAQLPNTAVAKLNEDGSFQLLFKAPLLANAEKINVSAPGLSLQQRAAAALTLLAQPNNN